VIAVEISGVDFRADTGRVVDQVRFEVRAARAVAT
jgi:hypothetical protein